MKIVDLFGGNTSKSVPLQEQEYADDPQDQSLLESDYDWRNEYYCRLCGGWTDGCRHVRQPEEE